MAGNYRADRHGPDDGGEADAPACPEFLNAVAKAEWLRVAPLLEARKIASPRDRAMFAAYCEAWAEWADAVQAVAAHKASKEKFGGMLVDHPRTIKRTAFEQLSKTAAAFLLTPSAKGQAAIVEAEKPKESIDRLFKGPRLAAG